MLGFSFLLPDLVGRVHPLDNTTSINYTFLGEQFGGIVPNGVPLFSFKPAIFALFYCYLYTEYGSDREHVLKTLYVQYQRTSYKKLTYLGVENPSQLPV